MSDEQNQPIALSDDELNVSGGRAQSFKEDQASGYWLFEGCYKFEASKGEFGSEHNIELAGKTQDTKGVRNAPRTSRKG